MVNKGEGTKGGSDAGEKQIAAERKALDRLHEKEQKRRNSSEVDTEPSGQGSEHAFLWQPASLAGRLNCIIPLCKPQPITCLQTERPQTAADSNQR